MSTSFRFATLADVPQLEQLEAELFYDNSLGDNLLEIELQWGPCWVCEQDGVIVGYLLARRTEGIVDITRVGVRVDMRQKGIGQQLLNCVLCPLHYLSVLTVRQGNEAAVQLYRKMGFVCAGEREGAWVLTRKWKSSRCGHKTCNEAPSFPRA